ncbi:DUF4442 domain-containing protein [bacterium]|nr:DUF4442 domain-containing protein [candidate division CSSED10-310 bacterium]
MSIAGPQLLGWWKKLEGTSSGRWLFSRLLGCVAPYTGSIAPRIMELAPGRAVVVMTDRRKRRNHLRSLHAVALMNLAEAASGLAVITALPAGARGILVGFDVSFTKKARGTITAEATVVLPDTSQRSTCDVPVALRDAAGDQVVMATAHWLIGPTGERGRQ